MARNALRSANSKTSPLAKTRQLFAGRHSAMLALRANSAKSSAVTCGYREGPVVLRDALRSMLGCSVRASGELPGSARCRRGDADASPRAITCRGYLREPWPIHTVGTAVHDVGLRTLREVLGLPGRDVRRNGGTSA